MPRYDVWFEVTDEYHATIEAESFDHASNMIYHAPRQYDNYGSLSCLDGNVKLRDWREIHE